MTAVAASVAPRRRVRRDGSRAFVRPALAVAGLLLAQEVATRTGVLPASYFPPVSEIATALAAEVTGGRLLQALGATVLTWWGALALALGLGTAVGTLLGLLPPLEALLRPVIEFLRPVPSVALIPLVVLTIGTGSRSALFLAVFAAFWQVLVPVVAGIRSAPPIALDTARVFGLGTLQRIRWIQLPSMLPQLMTAARLATSTSLILVVTAEIIIQMPGLGSEITIARTAGNPARMYAYIAVSGMAGIALNAAVGAITRRVNAAHGQDGTR
ncbi:ABC transporter permease [Litorihabitans aurantiacus]|uniref:Nitrate ABC transporter permease n=1 Tax=Litorihabitans aurantiacus TaxID=1930061 RepID=A0AA37XGY8_9MICO|nr:ABC transporter permease subunit [Litorihabitans aurantiacus]GMA32826.1 nitrate ABC transporter permease [Litorihabitans aurantiacus]